VNVLITGGAGYVGSHLVNVSWQAGYAVRALDLRAACAECVVESGCEFVWGSVTEAWS